MALEDKLWIFPYTAKSKSALALAEELDVWTIKRENSQFKGNPNRIIWNWGAGTGNFMNDTGGATVWNTPEQVDVAINKISFFEHMDEPDGPRIPNWTTSSLQAKRWLQHGYKVVARQQIEGAKGAGIVLMKNLVDFVPARLYTIKVDSTEEYRVYLFNGKTIDSRIKLPEKGMKEDADGMRYAEELYKFCPLGHELPQDVINQAEKCIKKTGLMTGGVDVLYNRENEEATVLEINSAPYIGGNTAAEYKKAILAYLKEAA